MSFGYGGFGDGFGNGFGGAWGNQGFGSQSYSNAAGGNNPSMFERVKHYFFSKLNPKNIPCCSCF